MLNLQQTLLATTRKILTSLIKTLMRNGMAYGEFDQIVRKCFVDVAYREFSTTKKKQTVSNVAILTGLNRKEVKKLHDLKSDQAASNSKQYNRITRVLGGWGNDPLFARPDGTPADLNYEGKNSFSDLVKKYSGDMPVVAMQKALINANNILITGDNKVRLLSRAYLPGDDSLEKLAILGTDTQQLVETIDYNLTAATEDLRFQRKASNQNVATSAVPALKQIIGKKGQAFLEEIDLYLTQHETREDSTTELSVSVFYHESSQLDEDDRQ